MTVPWEERERRWAVAVGQMEMRCLQGCSGRVWLEGAAGGAEGSEAGTGWLRCRVVEAVGAGQGQGRSTQLREMGRSRPEGSEEKAGT